jgi:hypothetical protein
MTEKQFQEIASLRTSLSGSKTSRDKAIAIAISRLFDHITELEIKLKIVKVNEEIKKAKQKSKTSVSTDPKQLVLFTVTLS